MQRYSKTPQLPKLSQRNTGKHVSKPSTRIHSASRRLGPEVVAQLVTDYEAGAPSTQLAKKYGISKTAVLGLLRSAGVTIRHQPLTGEQVAEVIRLYQAGWSMARIAERIGRDDSLVHLTLHRAGVPTRDPHGRER